MMFKWTVLFMPVLLIRVMFCDATELTSDSSSTGSEENSVMESSGIGSLSCVLNCGVEFGEAWTKLFQVNSLSQNSHPTTSLAGHGKFLHELLERTQQLGFVERRESVNRICIVYGEYRACLTACPTDIIRQSIEAGMSTLETVCGEKKEDYLNALPCLARKNTDISLLCKKQKDRVAISSMILHSSFITSPEKFLTALKDFCRAFANHTHCALPKMSESCGEATAGLLKNMWSRSFSLIQNVLSNTKMPLPLECKSILDELLLTEPVTSSIGSEPENPVQAEASVPEPEAIPSPSAEPEPTPPSSEAETQIREPVIQSSPKFLLPRNPYTSSAGGLLYPFERVLLWSVAMVLLAATEVLFGTLSVILFSA